MASTINYVNLADYINQLNPEILKEPVLKGRFVDQISHLPGIKNAEVINAIRSNPVLQTPTCGTILSPTGSVTPFQNTITTCILEYAEVMCPNDFEKKYFGMYAKLGSYNEDVTEQFSKVYTADKIDKIQAAIEDNLIFASTTGTFSTSTTTLCNGLMHTLLLTSASASIVNATGLSASFTVANAYSNIDAIITQLPSAIFTEPDLTLWLSYADYRTYVSNLKNNNWYHFDGNESRPSLVNQIYHPGTNIKISAERGFSMNTNGKHYFLLTNASNIWYGYDDANDYMKFQYFYSDLTDAVNFRCKFKIGINAAYYENIVLGVI